MSDRAASGPDAATLLGSLAGLLTRARAVPTDRWTPAALAELVDAVFAIEAALIAAASTDDRVAGVRFSASPPPGPGVRADFGTTAAP